MVRTVKNATVRRAPLSLRGLLIGMPPLLCVVVALAAPQGGVGPLPSASLTAVVKVAKSRPSECTSPPSTVSPQDVPRDVARQAGGSAVAGNGSLWVISDAALVSPREWRRYRRGDEWHLKYPWIRLEPGTLEISGKSLDGPGEFRAETAEDGYPTTGVLPSDLFFSNTGCWEVTGRLGSSSVTVYIEVDTAAALPVARRACAPFLARWPGVTRGGPWDGPVFLEVGHQAHLGLRSVYTDGGRLFAKVPMVILAERRSRVRIRDLSSRGPKSTLRFTHGTENWLDWTAARVDPAFMVRDERTPRGHPINVPGAVLATRPGHYRFIVSVNGTKWGPFCLRIASPR